MLGETTKKAIEGWGFETVVFITLTFQNDPRGAKEAQRRFHSLDTNVLAERYPGGHVKVLERGGANGRLHYHLLTTLGEDIRTGTDFEAVQKGDYRSLHPRIMEEWRFLREVLPRYGFGFVVEVHPLRKTGEEVAGYVQKYVTKHVASRRPEDKGAKLWSCTKNLKQGTTKFAWNNVNGWLWRQKLAIWANAMGMMDMAQIKEHYGPSWAYKYGDEIMAVRIDQGRGVAYPTGRHLVRDQRWLLDGVHDVDMDASVRVNVREDPDWDVRETAEDRHRRRRRRAFAIWEAWEREVWERTLGKAADNARRAESWVPD